MLKTELLTVNMIVCIRQPISQAHLPLVPLAPLVHLTHQLTHTNKIMKMPAYRKPGIEDLTDLKEYFLTEILNREGDRYGDGADAMGISSVSIDREMFMQVSTRRIG